MIVFNRAYEDWAPLAARLLLAVQFGVGAWFKVTGFSLEVGQSAAVGIPLPTIAVALALAFEILLVLSLALGAYVRPLALLGALYVALLAVLFYHHWSDPMTFGLFVSHLGLIAALLYVSAYGARSFALRKD
jgi:putative oxidoreductase